MKATRIHQHGGAGELRFEDAALPEPGPDEVRIRTAVASINPADYKHRSGMFKDFIPYSFPYTGGYDVAGTVDAVGPQVEGFRPGDQVSALLDPMRAGGYAEAVVTKAIFCAMVPAGLSLEIAAAIPCVGLTGAQLAEQVVAEAPGKRILVTGATGMVGRFVMHKAKALGAHVTAAVRPAYADEARALGADEIAFFGEAWTGAPFDGVVDTVGGEVATSLAASAVPGTPIITAATNPLNASRLSSEPRFIAVQPDGQGLADLGEAVANGAVPVPICGRYPLAHAGEAQARIEAGGVRGKILLMIA